MYVKHKFVYMPDSGSGGSSSGLSASVAGVAGGAFGMAGTIIGAVAQKKANERLMDYQDEWKYRDREWALQDWNMQNEYNSPIEQKQRLIQAGLNPALLYGGGSANTGQSMAVGRTNTSATPQYRPVDLSGLGTSLQSGLMTYLAVQKQTAEIDQMHIQNDLLRSKLEGQGNTNKLIVSKTNLTDAQASQVQAWVDAVQSVNQSMSGGDGSNAGGIIGQTMLAGLNNANANYTYKIDENARREMLSAKDAEQITERISLMEQQKAESQARVDQIKAATDLLIKSGVLKQIDIDGNRFFTNQFSGAAGQLLQGLLRRADIIR